MRNTQPQLRAKAFAARTARRRIWVLHLEATIQRVKIIEFATRNIERAFRIHHDAHTCALYQNVPIRWPILQIHLILQPRAATTDDRHTQYAVGPSLFGQQCADFFCGAFGKFDQALVTGPKSRSGGRFGCNVTYHLLSASNLRAETVRVNPVKKMHRSSRSKGTPYFHRRSTWQPPNAG